MFFMKMDLMVNEKVKVTGVYNARDAGGGVFA
jgi:hypothetical protein